MGSWTKDNNQKVFPSPLIIYHCALWQKLVIARLLVFCWIPFKKSKHSTIIFTIPFGEASGAKMTRFSIKY